MAASRQPWGRRLAGSVAKPALTPVRALEQKARAARTAGELAPFEETGEKMTARLFREAKIRAEGHGTNVIISGHKSYVPASQEELTTLSRIISVARAAKELPPTTVIDADFWNSFDKPLDKR